jgi:DNA-binding CsgD family transcriptional regulator/catechol 2,3-dioxygenase-like lactoylglutathione lyase family enzyme
MKNLRRGRPPHDDLLTPAEWQVVHAVKHGLRNREIAQRRGVSLDAVKFHIANAVQKLGLGGRNGLKHWHRAPRGSPLSSSGPIGVRTEEKSVDSTVKLGAVGQIVRSVRDIKESETWYRDVLGMKHLFSVGTLAFFDCGGTRLMLSQDKMPGAESLLYWQVADIAAVHAALQGRGVEFINAPHMIFKHPDGTEEWLCNFKDAEDRPLGLIAQAAPKT